MNIGCTSRSSRAFAAGALIGLLGGLIGLGGAEFRLPVLVGMFRLPTLDAVIFNKGMSLVVVAAALVFRAGAIPLEQLTPHLDAALNLLAGSGPCADPVASAAGLARPHPADGLGGRHADRGLVWAA